VLLVSWSASTSKGNKRPILFRIGPDVDAITVPMFTSCCMPG
jgi:hypothetical protein